MWKHFCDTHKEEEANINADVDQIHDSDAEKDQLKNEIKRLQNNFQRLEGLFKDSLDEAEKNKAEYEDKIVSLSENLRVTKAENIELKERIDVLFKLGRSYLNRVEEAEKAINVSRPNETHDNTDTNNHDIQVINPDQIDLPRDKSTEDS